MKCIPKQKHALKIKSDDKTKNFKIRIIKKV